MALIVFDYTLHVEFVAYCMITVALIKLVCYMRRLFENPGLWYHEIAYRNLIEWRDVNGVAVPVEPNLNRKWFMDVMWSLIMSIWLAQQFILVLLLVDIRRWNTVLQQIMLFHNISNLPAPQIEFYAISNYTSWWIFLKIFFLFNLGACVLFAIIDKIFETWRTTPLSSIKSIMLLSMFLICGNVWLVCTNAIVFNYSKSEFQLISLLKEDVMDIYSAFVGFVTHLLGLD